MKSADLKQRVTRLERIIAVQQQLIDRLGIIANGHQRVIEAIAGPELTQQQPAPRAPLSTMN